MTEAKKSSKKIWLGVAGLVVLVAALITVFLVFGPKTTEGSKAITIEVINKAQESVVYEVKTDAEYLYQAMDEADGLTYETENGMVMSINGEVADYSVDSSYWAFYINDGYCNYGIDLQPVTDGDEFQIIYTVME